MCKLGKKAKISWESTEIYIYIYKVEFEALRWKKRKRDRATWDIHNLG